MPGSTQLKPPRAAHVRDGAQAGAGLRTFARIVGKWNLPASDAMALLGVDSRSTYYELLKRARESKEVKGLSKDQLDRLSYLLGIYAAMRVLFPHSEESRNEWVSRANTAYLFGGRSPIEVMRSGMIGLYQTFAHLVAARAW
ncbi:MAG TPA: antitoxin Xre-like helix-turn-helix domain-containing protein [Gemmatimonadaceae bacterium]|nr:antitoxin Xre-like helix-turn-helix domain-containing protein [Gemmatimonadaceae bacterium]